MAAIEDGLYQPSMKARMAELEREKAEITARLAEAPVGIPYVHPGIAEIYKRKVAKLTERSEEHTSELQSLMRISYAVFCLKKKNKKKLRSNEERKLRHRTYE